MKKVQTLNYTFSISPILRHGKINGINGLISRCVSERLASETSTNGSRIYSR